MLEAGTPLVQSELSARLGVSKTPIREAIRDLAAEGLIDFDSYRSSVVHTPTLEEAREIYDLRLVLEPIAVRKAVTNITDESIAEAEQLAKEMRRTTDLGAWVDLNRVFHEKLTEPASSPRLLAIIEGLRNAAGIQIAWSLKDHREEMVSASDEHDLILDAYRRRDADAAVEASEQHLSRTLETVEQFERERERDDSAPVATSK